MKKIILFQKQIILKIVLNMNRKINRMNQIEKKNQLIYLYFVNICYYS